MKNSTLIIRSLLVVSLIAGGAHLVRIVNNKQVKMSEVEEKFQKTELNVSHESQEENIVETQENQYNETTDYIQGKWAVTYDTEEFRGVVVYSIKKENSLFNAYVVAYRDLQGNQENADGSKSLIINKFDGYKGYGVYNIDYEGEVYEVECRIDMLDENTFQLSYEYYGYVDTETWKREK